MPDAAPLWLPADEASVVDQAAARPADFVEGYGWKQWLVITFLGSNRKVASMVSTALAALLFLAIAPSLLGSGVGGVFKIVFYQSFTLALMLIATVRVRSVSISSLSKYWLAGLFTVAMVAFFLNGPLANLADPSSVWVTPILEELLKAVPLGVAVFVGRQVWRHPGLSDLMLLGFAVGGGYALHEEALWERAAVSGFEANAGLVVPSIFQPDGLFVVGHAVWTSIIGLAIGLFLLHRHQAPALVAAVVASVAVVGDHMAINDADGTLDSVRQLLFNGKLLALIFLVGFAGAVVLDRRRLAATAARDHLFPSDITHGVRPLDPGDEDSLQSVLVNRYRRLRNGMHTTIDATTQQWPPRSESHPAPVAELARLGRAAAVAVGPGTSDFGWAPDPETPTGMRFVGPEGFTAYAAGDEAITVEPVVDTSDFAELDDPDLDDATRAKLEKRAAAAADRALRKLPTGPTVATMSTPKARSQASGVATIERRPEFWQYLGLTIVAVVLFSVVRLVTAGEASTALIETALSLPDATNSPALIRGLLGAAFAGVALIGSGPKDLGAGWEVGPGDDPRPDRPDECEA